MGKLVKHLKKLSIFIRYKSSHQTISSTILVGCVPIYVGDVSHCFIVGINYLNHPLFVELLDLFAGKFGYFHK
jgi:hypothetical protein